MKKTLFTALLAAALLSCGSSFAGTLVEGYDKFYSELPNEVYGKYASELAADLGFMRIKEDAGSLYPELGNVTGGYVECGLGDAEASFNTIVMTAGVANSLCGGRVQGEGGNYTASYNTVVMAGGKVAEICGGAAGGGDNRLENNKVVVTGGVVGSICGARVMMNSHKSIVYNNAVDLVGEGAEYTYDDEQRGTFVFVGGKIQVGTVCAASVKGDVDCFGNPLNISGTGIQVGEVGADFQRLNFHLLADQLTGSAPMVTVTEENGLSITEGLILSFDAVEGMEWKPGDSVTLVVAQKGMNIVQDVLDREYDIHLYGNPSTIVATARLVLEQGQGGTQFLKLTVPGVPEPITGVLSLLALAALAARRRK